MDVSICCSLLICAPFIHVKHSQICPSPRAAVCPSTPPLTHCHTSLTASTPPCVCSTQVTHIHLNLIMLCTEHSVSPCPECPVAFCYVLSDNQLLAYTSVSVRDSLTQMHHSDFSRSCNNVLQNDPCTTKGQTLTVCFLHFDYMTYCHKSTFKCNLLFFMRKRFIIHINQY